MVLKIKDVQALADKARENIANALEGLDALSQDAEELGEETELRDNERTVLLMMAKMMSEFLLNATESITRIALMVALKD